MSILPGSRCGGCGADLSLYPTSAAAHICFGPQAVHMTQVWCNRDHAAIEADAAQAERERLRLAVEGLREFPVIADRRRGYERCRAAVLRLLETP